MRIAIVLVVASASLLITAGLSNLLEPGDAKGEIIAAHASPELLAAGQLETFEADVRNLGDEADFMIEVRRDSSPIEMHRFKLFASENKTVSFSSSKPPFAGESNYTYSLYSGTVFGPKTLLGSFSEKRRVYSQRELSDEDGDGLKYFEEVKLGTEPGLADTDGDNIPDNADQYPTQASGSLNINSAPVAEVYLDSALSGSTPLYIPYVFMGLHRIEVIKKGYTTAVQMVSLKPGETLNLSFMLSPVQEGLKLNNQSTVDTKKVFIYAASDPSGTDVFLDDVFVGTTPLVINAQPGTHRVLFRKNGFKDYSLQINVTSNDENVFVNMEQAE